MLGRTRDWARLPHVTRDLEMDGEALTGGTSARGASVEFSCTISRRARALGRRGRTRGSTAVGPVPMDAPPAEEINRSEESIERVRARGERTAGGRRTAELRIEGTAPNSDVLSPIALPPRTSNLLQLLSGAHDGVRFLRAEFLEWMYPLPGTKLALTCLSGGERRLTWLGESPWPRSSGADGRSCRVPRSPSR